MMSTHSSSAVPRLASRPSADTATPVRCEWARRALDVAYHDTEWGVPLHDERRLFECLILEGAQAGLSWSTILARREHYRRAFDQFDVEQVARYGAADSARLLSDAGIIRNRLKIAAAIGNARAFLQVQARWGSFDRFLWDRIDGRPIQGHRTSMIDVPLHTPLAVELSRELQALGFRFVGPTIMYAFMQAIGMVNDHVCNCFRWFALGGDPARLGIHAEPT